MNKDLKIIKKKYGEKMAHLCKSMFSTILEVPNLLSTILMNHFAFNKDLYDDLVEQDKLMSFKDFIYSIYKEDILDKEKKEKEISEIDATPEELLSKVGYELYACHSEEEIQSFRKYFADGEVLCTFKGGRLEKCHVFFAIKKDVDKIKRDSFKHPEREDAYGISVISIQFTKDFSHTLSIKNRYNHVVDNPDATFSNNLDEIVEGLSLSFAKYYGLEQKYVVTDFYLKQYIRASNGKFYKYNFSYNDIYYCPNNVIIDHSHVKEFDKSLYIVFDYFILELKKVNIKNRVYAYDKQSYDSFPRTMGAIKKVDVVVEEDLRKLFITPVEGEVITIMLNQENEIVGYENPNVVQIGSYFLWNSRNLKYLSLPLVENIGHCFLYSNRKLDYLCLPNLVSCQSDIQNILMEEVEVDFPCVLKKEKKKGSFEV